MDNQMKRMKSYKFITSISLFILMLIFAIGATIPWYMINFTEGEADTLVIIISYIMFLILPWGLTIWAMKHCLTVVTINEKGIERRLFGFMFKRYISWEELYEIRLIYILTGGGWIFFSKKSLEKMSIGKARSQKGQIQVVYTKRLLEVIQLFTDREIVNLPIDNE